MSTATARAYRSNFADRFMPSGRRTSPEIKPFHGYPSTYLRKAHCIKDRVLLDPFCGVGTMLIERNKKVPASYMYGTDTFGEAIEGARTNAAMAQADINYVNRDFFDFTSDYLFDEVITNFPDLYSSEADEFYREFFVKCSSILRKQGLIIAYSKEKGLIRKHLRLNNDYKLLREFAFDDKEGYSVYVISKTGEEIQHE